MQAQASYAAHVGKRTALQNLLPFHLYVDPRVPGAPRSSLCSEPSCWPLCVFTSYGAEHEASAHAYGYAKSSSGDCSGPGGGSVACFGWGQRRQHCLEVGRFGR